MARAPEQDRGSRNAAAVLLCLVIIDGARRPTSGPKVPCHGYVPGVSVGFGPGVRRRKIRLGFGRRGEKAVRLFAYHFDLVTLTCLPLAAGRG